MTDPATDKLVEQITPHKLTGDDAAVMISAGKLRAAVADHPGLIGVWDRGFGPSPRTRIGADSTRPTG